jgi:UDP-glucose 4-epimerase
LVDKQTARDFIYVDDVVAFYENVEELKKCVGQTLNVGRGEQVTLEEVVKTIFKVTKKTVPTEWRAMAGRPWDTSTWQADMKKTFNLVSWRPKNSLNDGITKMWKWFPAAADHYKE